MAINPLLLKVKPISEITTVDNPTEGHLLFYDGGNELKKVDIVEFQSLIGGIAKPLAISDASPTVSGWYKPTTVGTYTNAGNLVAQSGYDTLFYFNGTTWSLIAVDLPQPIVNNYTNNNTYNLDPEQIVPSESLYNDETLAGDILKRVDKTTGENVNYREITKWHDGSAMDDSKVDGFVYKKNSNKYYQRVFGDTINILECGAIPNVINDTLTNALILALNVANGRTVLIPEGDFWIDPHLENSNQYVGYEGKIQLPDNSHLKMLPNTFLKAIPNDKRFYAMLSLVNCDNVTIEGGNIVGDVEQHIGTTGEWGFGISVLGASNCTIKNVNISKCWGDGIIFEAYKSKNDLDYLNIEKVNTNNFIDNVTLDYNRRNGMAITNVDGLIISNTTILNTGKISGTAPMYGLDVEGDIFGRAVTKNVLFENCIFKGNVGGQFACQGAINEDNGKINIDGLTLRNCKTINEDGSYDTLAVEGDNIVVENCNAGYFYIQRSKRAKIINNNFHSIAVHDYVIVSDEITITGNTLYRPNASTYSIDFSTNCKNYLISNNTIIYDVKPDVFVYVPKLVNDIVKVRNCVFTYNGTEGEKEIRGQALMIDCDFKGFGTDNFYGFFKNGDNLKVRFATHKDIQINLTDKNSNTIDAEYKMMLQSAVVYIQRVGDIKTGLEYNYFSDAYFYPKAQFINSGNDKNTMQIVVKAIRSSNLFTFTMNTCGNEVDISFLDRDLVKPTLMNSKIASLSDIDNNNIFNIHPDSIFKQKIGSSYVLFNPKKKLIGQGTFVGLPESLTEFHKGLIAFDTTSNTNKVWNGTSWM